MLISRECGLTNFLAFFRRVTTHLQSFQRDHFNQLRGTFSALWVARMTKKIRSSISAPSFLILLGSLRTRR